MNIVWFRQDLRVFDNPALIAAAEAGDILPVYILDHDNAGAHKMGGASLVWLYHALADLNHSLGGNLRFYVGDAGDVLSDLCDAHDVQGVYWNRCYEPWRISRDKAIKQNLSDAGVRAESFNGSLLWEPWEILKKDGTPYKVFTPFYRKGCLGAEAPRAPFGRAEPQYSEGDFGGVGLDDLGLLPDIDWDDQMVARWDISERGAMARLRDFLDDGVDGYKEGRNFPARNHVSRLSPYLHFGQISPHQVWHETLHQEQSNNIDVFQSELGWREFSHSLLYHFPDLPRKNLQAKFDSFPWAENDAHLNAWQKGMTGYPIVDAGMRELWQTGYMHNRVRMVVGSFLVKNLLLHWHHGEAWFWDCLFDADLANNSASWQWIAGCGADAAPYFRVFNPITQGEKFDAGGDYIRQYCPELKNVPDKYLCKPWDAPEDVLKRAGVVLGRDYPRPIVDVKASRERALEAFQSLKKQ